MDISWNIWNLACHLLCWIYQKALKDQMEKLDHDIWYFPKVRANLKLAGFFSKREMCCFLPLREKLNVYKLYENNCKIKTTQPLCSAGHRHNLASFSSQKWIEFSFWLKKYLSALHNCPGCLCWRTLVFVHHVLDWTLDVSWNTHSSPCCTFLQQVCGNWS